MNSCFHSILKVHKEVQTFSCSVNLSYKDLGEMGASGSFKQSLYLHKFIAETFCPVQRASIVRYCDLLVDFILQRTWTQLREQVASHLPLLCLLETCCKLISLTNILDLKSIQYLFFNTGAFKQNTEDKLLFFCDIFCSKLKWSRNAKMWRKSVDRNQIKLLL